MLGSVVETLANSTPALRARYLNRVRTVPGPQARNLEATLEALVERDQARYAA